MDSRVHGNDSWWFGGGVLIFYGIVALLMCLVSSHPLLFQLLPYNFALLASFCLSARHPREDGGTIVQRVLSLGITASLPVLSVLLYVVVGCGKCVSKRDIRRVWMNGFPCARV
ncbi:hypothetical protein RB978_004084 [Vibrio vulnificus]|nr:hypothetical protein [Vibrio vulnificus]